MSFVSPLPQFEVSFLEQFLRKEQWEHLQLVLSGKIRLDAESAEALAEAFKNWGLKHGVSHFAYSFHPLACTMNEKLDGFHSWNRGLSFARSPIQNLKGRELLCKEVNPSSFFSLMQSPSHLLDGHLVWETSSFPFIRMDESGTKILVIPALFFSSDHEALDLKIPLLRAEEKLRETILRLLHFCVVSCQTIQSNMEITQQFYIVDRALYLRRKDLMAAGRDLCGDLTDEAKLLSEMENERRIPAFVGKVEEAARQLGLFVKISPVGRSKLQWEATLRSETGSKAVDQHALFIELMEKIGAECGVAPLFHTQPFALMNPSHLRIDWALMTSDGQNLFSGMKERKIVYLAILTAIVYSIYEHTDLLCAAAACPNYDARFSKLNHLPILNFEALFAPITGVLSEGNTAIRQDRSTHLPAFISLRDKGMTVRGAGSSVSPAFIMSAFYAAVSDSLSLILDELADAIGNRMEDTVSCFDRAVSVLRKRCKEAKTGLSSRKQREGILFRPENADAFIDKKSVRGFSKILNENELQRYRWVYLEQYGRAMKREAELMAELFRMQVLPLLMKAYGDSRMEMPAEVSASVTETIHTLDALDKLQAQCADLGSEIKAKVFFEMGVPKMVSIQPLPKFWLPKNI